LVSCRLTLHPPRPGHHPSALRVVSLQANKPAPAPLRPIYLFRFMPRPSSPVASFNTDPISPSPRTAKTTHRGKMPTIGLRRLGRIACQLIVDVFFAGMRGCDEFTDRGHRQIDEVTERGGCQRLTMQKNHPPPLREQFHSYATILFYAVWVKTQQMNNSRNVWPLVILWNTTTNTFKYRSMLHNNCRCRKRITQRI